MSDQTDTMPRIGRPATPIERGHQLTVENPKLLNDLAYNLFESTFELPTGTSRAAWNALTEEQREQWRVEILDSFNDEIQNQEFDRSGPDGDGGPGNPAITNDPVTQAA